MTELTHSLNPQADEAATAPVDTKGHDETFVRPIQEFNVAKQTAVRNLARALVEQYAFSEGGAMAIAQAVADPAAVRKQLATPDETTVFGGTLLTVSTRISSLAVIPHVTNGRVIGATPYPASDTDGTFTQPKYWPERDLKSNGSGELVLAGGTRSRVIEALGMADAELLAHNGWEESIRTNGVFAPITAAVLKVETDDEEDVWALSAVDGSSRVASCHRILGLDVGDPLYGSVAIARNARGRVQELMSVVHRSRDEVTPSELERARAATVPATIVVGFRPDQPGRGDLMDALDEYVALLHLEPPTPWAGPARDNKIADSVIDALREAKALNDERAFWFAGMLVPADAATAGLSTEADERSADILRTITAPSDTDAGYAIGLGIRRRTLRQRIHHGPKAEVAASLALRSYSTANVNRRKVATALLEDIYLLDEHWESDWAVTGRDPDDILEAALEEHEVGVIGSNIKELAALAAYHITTHGALATQEGGSGDITDPGTGLTRPRDKREPRAVFGSMLHSAHGLYALHRTIVDGRKGQAPLQVDERGFVAVTVNREPVGPMNNFWMRTVFRENGAAPVTQKDTPASPRQQLTTAVKTLKSAVSAVTEAVAGIEGVTVATGTPLVDIEGVDESMVNDLREKLEDARESLAAYKRTWQRRHPRPSNAEPTEDDLEDES
jgi:hypothetical protein